MWHSTPLWRWKLDPNPQSTSLLCWSNVSHTRSGLVPASHGLRMPESLGFSVTVWLASYKVPIWSFAMNLSVQPIISEESGVTKRMSLTAAEEWDQADLKTCLQWSNQSHEVPNDLLRIPRLHFAKYGIYVVYEVRPTPTQPEWRTSKM